MLKGYYLEEAKQQKWSVRQLERNINSFYYERLLSSQEKKKELIAQKKIEKTPAKDFIKDPHVLEFLGLPENHSQKKIQSKHLLLKT